MTGIFGKANRSVSKMDFSKVFCADESTVYKSKNLDKIKIPTLPKTATEKWHWDRSATASVGAIDLSPDDLLTEWFSMATDVTGDRQEA